MARLFSSKIKLQMRNSNLSKALLLLSILGLVFAGCQRDPIWDGEIFASVDNSLAESEFSSIGNLIDYEARSDSNLFGKTAETQGFYCPAAGINVTLNGGNSATLTIDFGSGTNCLDGRLRTGRLIAEFNGKWRDQGSTVRITPDAYTISNATATATYAVTFVYDITMNGRDGDGNLNWTNVITNANFINSATNERISWQGTRTTTWIEGEGSTDLSSYVYRIEGTASGNSRNGRAFTAEVTAPLIVELNCPNVVSGVLEVSPQDLETRSIDYGTGACDGIAQLTVGSFVTQINLP